jgi:hypothetical protein
MFHVTARETAEKNMHAELKAADEFDPTHDAPSASEDAAFAPSAHSLLAVLFPANPPAPKNARIIRLFDIEAAKYDPRPGEPAPSASGKASAAAPAPKKENSRSVLKEERSKSLFAAARYF